MSFTTRALRPSAAPDGRPVPSVVSARPASGWQLVAGLWQVVGCRYAHHAEAVPV